MPEFLGFVLRRLAESAFLLVAISLLIFGVVQLLPGDAVDIMLSGVSLMSLKQETIAELRHQLGLDRPLHEQYARWIFGVLQGDFGTSLIMKGAIGPIILERLKASLLLAGPASAMMVATGLLLGVAAAVRENSWTDRLVLVFALLAKATPAFVVGSVFLYVFAVRLEWIPAAFNAVNLASLGFWNTVALFATVLIFPCLTVTFESAAHILLQARASMVEELKTNYVRMALIKGVPRRRIIFRHALPNALLPAITVIAINVGYVISGIVVVEVVFSYPGIGNLMLTAIELRDVPLILGTVLVIAGSYVLMNLVADILYAALNPRIRYA